MSSEAEVTQNTTPKFETLRPELIEQVKKLPKEDGIVLRFVDFDDTIAGSLHRFEICPDLAQNRGDLAIALIAQKYWTSIDPTGITQFVSLLDPKWHLLDGYADFYDPTDPHNIILTAGNTELQTKKILAAGFNLDNSIIVPSAPKKMNAILEKLIEIWYVPWEIHFYDDRITDFDWADVLLSELLDIPVVFYEAIQDVENQTVRVEQRVFDILQK